MRIGIVQFAPKVECIEENIKIARNLTKNLTAGSLDLLCFPETAFTGYVFPTPKSIEPFLEQTRAGPSSSFCSSLAKRLECYVVAGYPERLADGERIEEKPDILGANGATLFGPDGEPVGHYRKSHLYELDVPWAKAGPGFSKFELPDPLGTLSLAICMDLNPRITTPNPHGWPYELATWCIESKSKVLVLLCAWLHSSHSEHRTQEEKEESKKSDWDLHTAKYWCERLRPLWDDECSVGNDDVEDMERTVIICNRNGLERGYLFAGTSIILKMSRKKGSPEVIGIMKKDEQALRTFNF